MTNKKYFITNIPGVIFALSALFWIIMSIKTYSRETIFFANQKDKNDTLVLGAERIDTIVERLNHKRVALVVNQTSVVNGIPLIDFFQEHGVNVKGVFCPEHGCIGKADAGEHIEVVAKHKSGIPIFSLYGKNRKPTRQQLQNIDIVVFDIQDVGVRFYTYVSTLQYVMEACAENNKTILILDRPNPNGEYIDGPVLKPEFRSFVGLNPIPIVHGMTIGELGQMINGEGWLQGKIKANLEVMAMLNYTHTTPYLPPIAPSPNLPTQNAIKWYPSIALFEGTVISVGRGTYTPFEIVGNPDLPHHLEFRFTPKSIVGMTKKPRYKDMNCYGFNLQKSKPKAEITLQYLIHLFKIYPHKDQFFNTFFNKLAGNSQLQQQIKEGMSEKEIKASWREEIEEFKKIREHYLIYPE